MIPEHIRRVCRDNRVIPIEDNSSTLTIVAQTVSLKRDSQLGLAINRQINTRLYTPDDFIKLWRAVFGEQNQTMLSSTQPFSTKELIDHLLIAALHQRASDIHFEPNQHDYRVRFRVDGVLKLAMKPDLKFASSIPVRLKIMARLDIAEKRLPQDGQLVFHHYGKQYVMRMSTLPVTQGEKIVLRIIKQSDHTIDIHHLGLTSADLRQYQRALAMTQGLILVCGPTGSGKTVTLYSGLHEIDREKRNVCCVEDPIEMPLEGVNQSQINNKSQLTFAILLRAFLRQDPDVIMIGEIRDKETAHIAMQAAHTGHLVLSTLHTNSSCEAIIRLNQIGIANHLLASGLKLIISQRLLRLLCPRCKQRANHNTVIKGTEKMDKLVHYEAKGCAACNDGYHGRTAIYEFLVVSSPMIDLLFSTTPVSITRLEHYAKQQGMVTLYQAGIEVIKKGLTSFAELIRVTNVI